MQTKTIQTINPPNSYSKKDYQNELKPIWCPGCGDFGVLSALYQALSELQIPPHQLAFISGIGCSSRIPGYTHSYGFNAVHGRALPIALGVKLANPALTVITASGDGDAFSIGGGHLPHIIRRNPNITLVVMDNNIYGLTKGQASPTTAPGTLSVSSPYGALEQPINPLLQLLAYGCGFIAQASVHDLKQLIRLLVEAINYPGLAIVNVHSPCVTYGPEDKQAKMLRLKALQLSELQPDPTDKLNAYKLAEEHSDKIYGLLYLRRDLPEFTQIQQALQTRVRIDDQAPYDVREIFKRNFSAL